MVRRGEPDTEMAKDTLTEAPLDLGTRRRTPPAPLAWDSIGSLHDDTTSSRTPGRKTSQGYGYISDRAHESVCIVAVWADELARFDGARRGLV